MDKRFLSVKEAGHYLNLSQSFLYKLVETKQIPHLKVGRKVLFDLAKLEKWIEENEVQVEDWSRIK